MSLPSVDAIALDISGSIAAVTFNRPASRNCLSTELFQRLEEVLSELLPSPNLDCIIFTGTDTVFLSGADILEVSGLDEAAATEFSYKGQQLFQKVAEARQTTIAAIDGFCLGGGLDFALACDLRIASTTAVFAHPGARLGIITGWGGTQRLTRLIGRNSALDLFATTRRINSDEALRLRLISAIHDPVMEGALRLAKKIGTTNPS